VPDAIESLSAPSFPLRRGPSGYPAMVTGDDLIRESVMQVIGTEPGERGNRPTFGVRIRRHLFAPNDVVLAEAIRGEIEQALPRFEPRVAIVRISAVRVPGEKAVRVVVEYRLKSTSELQQPAVVDFPLPTKG
jgi:phage baseplate assembly protein W